MSNSPSARPPRERVSETVRVAASFARARIQLRGTRLGARVRSFGRILVPQPEGITIGRQVSFLEGSVPTALRCERGGELVVGDRSICNYGVEIASSRSVRIGNDCLIASLVHIRDNDGRRSSPVTIGDEVWIAFGAVIEPGTVIGDQSVVATMAVVSGVVPPRSLVAGNPAQSVPLDPTAPLERQSTTRPTAADGPQVRARPSSDAVRGAILEWLDDTRLFGDAARRIASDTMSLRDSGLLDSLAIFELILMLEERFGVTINRERAAGAEAGGLRALIELVTEYSPALSA